MKPTSVEDAYVQWRGIFLPVTASPVIEKAVRFIFFSGVKALMSLIGNNAERPENERERLCEAWQKEVEAELLGHATNGKEEKN